MQRPILIDGMRQSGLIRALVRLTEGLALAAGQDALVLAADGPVLTLLPADDGGPLEALLAPGLYRVAGRLVDTRNWPEAARRLPVPWLPGSGGAVALHLGVEWRARNWSARDEEFDPGARPAATGDRNGVPIDDVLLVTEEPVPFLRPRTLAGDEDSLFLAQMTVSRHGADQLDPAVLPPIAAVGAVGAVGDAILGWLQPLLAVASALDLVACTAAVDANPTARHKAGRAGDLAAAMQRSVRLAGAVSLSQLLPALRADFDRLLRLLGADALPDTPDTTADGFDLRTWLPIAGALTAMQLLLEVLEADAAPGIEGLVLPPEALSVSRPVEGRISIRADLQAPLWRRLGLGAPFGDFDIRVEPARPEHALRGIGSALVHPHLPNSRLPAFLGLVPIETDSRGNLLLRVRMDDRPGSQKFAEEVEGLFAASQFRLELEAAFEGCPDREPAPVKLTIVPVA